MVADLYALPTCTVGGPLHIILDDGNCRDSDLDFCRDEVTGGEHWSMAEATPEDRAEIARLSLAIIDFLRPSTEAQRRAIIKEWCNV